MTIQLDYQPKRRKPKHPWWLYALTLAVVACMVFLTLIKKPAPKTYVPIELNEFTKQSRSTTTQSITIILAEKDLDDLKK